MDRTATLLGAAEVLRGEINIEMIPNLRVEYGQELDALRREMDGQKIASSWSNGRAMTMEQANEFSLANPE